MKEHKCEVKTTQKNGSVGENILLRFSGDGNGVF